LKTAGNSGGINIPDEIHPQGGNGDYCKKKDPYVQLSHSSRTTTEAIPYNDITESIYSSERRNG
jgi:hypothetical protein